MENLAAHLDIVDHVSFTGWLNQEQIAKLYQQSDVFVFPSLRDCGGAVVLEAMAMNLPIIAARWGGPVDYITKECGFLIDPISTEQYIHDFSQAMLLLAHSPGLRKKMGQHAREHVLKHFQWDKKTEDLQDIYHFVIQQVKSRDNS